MYQTVGHDAIYLYSECMDVPLYRREILGGSILQSSDYTVTPEDETEDLYELLKEVLVRITKGKQKVRILSQLLIYLRIRNITLILKVYLWALFYQTIKEFV